MKQEVIASAIKASPPMAVSAAMALHGIPLDDWVLILTVIYLILQIMHLLWRWVFPVKESA